MTGPDGTGWRPKPLPPSWKIKREITRIKMQLTAPFSLALQGIVRPRYDRTKHQRITLTPGDVAPTGDIAIFLIYAPSGPHPSYFHTLKHLRDKGFAPFVVANHPLTDDMRAALSPHVWQMMERPNVGYDFGGYRDAILHLLDAGTELEHLLVLNDSVWFPLDHDDTMLDDMRGWSENVTGFCMDRHRVSQMKPFIQSFLFMFDGTVFRAPEFRDYWENILLTNNKHLVIRRLEMGMSTFFQEAGFSVRALFEYSALPDRLAAMDLARQIRFLEIEAPRLGEMAAGFIERLESGEGLSAADWQTVAERSQVDGHILKLPPELLFDVFDINMLKKLKRGHFMEQRAALIDAGYHERLLPVIRDEVTAWDTPEELAHVRRRRQQREARRG